MSPQFVCLEGETHMATILELAEKILRGEAAPPPISRLLGFVLKVIEPGRAVFEMEADERRHNPMGTLHGGIYCDLADAAMGFASSVTVVSPRVSRPRIARRVGSARAAKVVLR